MLSKWFVLIGFIMITVFSAAYAEDMNSPVGKWITISDKTKERSGMVDLYIRDGKLYGKIIKMFPMRNTPNPETLCVKCPGAFKNKPKVGLVFLWGLKPNSDGSWSDGSILDPKEGNIYAASLNLANNGKELKVRGYWMFFWRTQTWIRAN
jgi:uncharacterized protein (DUF2147 family)